METKKNYLKLLIFFAVITISFTSCSTYQGKTSEIQDNVFDSNFKVASASIEKNSFLLKPRNRLLYLFEKGKVEHLNGNYELSNQFLEEAYILIDDKIKTDVGQAIASKLTNPMAEPYKGEDFEKVLIHYYKALNYFQLGNKEDAIVEAKRINIKLLKLNENYKENKNTYAQDAFSQIVLGILFESTNQINDAFIAYRNAEEIYQSHKGVYFDVPIPEQLKIDLQRTSKAIGFTKDYNDYVKKYGKKTISSATDEAIVFWENGKGPAKDQIKLTASGAGGAFVGTYDDDLSNIIIPIPANVNLGINAIAIPKYTKRASYYNSASLIVNNKEQKFELCQDLYPIAKQCLKDRMMREVINIAIRYGAKKAVSKGLGFLGNQLLPSYASGLTGLAVDGANAATEKADTRNWQTLPATISYIRVPVINGENKFVFKKYSDSGIDVDTLIVAYKKGLQIVNCHDYDKIKDNVKNNNLEVASLANQPILKLDETVTPKSTFSYVNQNTVNNVSEVEKKSNSNFGIVAGFQISDEVGDEIQSSASRTGYFAGLSYKPDFTQTVGLDMNLIYSTMGAEFEGLYKDNLSYIQLPVCLNFNLTQKFSLQVGPQAGYLIGAKFDNEDYIDTLNAFDYGLAGGLQVDFKNNFGILGKFYYGLANINIDTEIPPVTNNAISIGLFCKF
jgi:uncharacterized protein